MNVFFAVIHSDGQKIICDGAWIGQLMRKAEILLLHDIYILPYALVSILKSGCGTNLVCKEEIFVLHGVIFSGIEEFKIMNYDTNAKGKNLKQL